MKVRRSASSPRWRWSRSACGAAVSSSEQLGSASGTPARGGTSVHGVDRDRGAVHRSGRRSSASSSCTSRSSPSPPTTRRNGTNVTLAQDDTQLTPSIAVTKTAGDHRLERGRRRSDPRAARRSRRSARCSRKAGMAFISGSATLPALTTSGKNPTFFRVVPDDDVQGPQDANYIINHLHPKAVLIIDDEEAYSQGLVNVMIADPQGGRHHGQPPDATTARTPARRSRTTLSSLVTSQLNAERDGHGPAVAERRRTPSMFGQRRQAAGQDDDRCSGPTAPTRRRSSSIPGTYVSNFGPDISTVDERARQGDRHRRREVRPVRRVRRADLRGGRRRDEGDRVGLQGRARRRAARTCSPRSRRRTSPRRRTRSGSPIAFTVQRRPVGQHGYLFKINSAGQVHRRSRPSKPADRIALSARRRRPRSRGRRRRAS